MHGSRARGVASNAVVRRGALARETRLAAGVERAVAAAASGGDDLDGEEELGVEVGARRSLEAEAAALNGYIANFAGGVDEGTNRLSAKLRGCGRGEWKSRGGSGWLLREGRAATGGRPAGEGVRPLLRAPCPVLQAGGSSSARACVARRAVAAGSVQRRAVAAGSARGGHADGSSSSFGCRQSRDEGDKHTPPAALASRAGRIWRQRAVTRRPDLGPAAGERQQRRARTRQGSAGGGALRRRRPFLGRWMAQSDRRFFFGHRLKALLLPHAPVGGGGEPGEGERRQRARGGGGGGRRGVVGGGSGRRRPRRRPGWWRAAV
ncbi:hypothetical protein PVAP13_9KG308038 [Panicum virgatum]|uniref:Uncharacterized protein n=1 Tax=Panicum virgatum TaxID=38727 RepID=A0A8T0N9E2_PANVG|nr:hypothetical protein PVAP13_9KG308038 [Panicum virgatum]